MAMELYKHQILSIAALKSGKKFMIANMGSGKGACMLHWLKSTGKKKWLMVTTASKRDSCFPAGSLVNTTNGQKPIEQVQVGDIVYAFNGKHLTKQPVTRSIKLDTEERLIRISFGGGCDVIATENHPIYVGNGKYIKAKNITEGDYIYAHTSATTAQPEASSRSNREVFRAMPRALLQLVQAENSYAYQSSKRPMVTQAHNVLLSSMLQEGTSQSDSANKRARLPISISEWSRVQLMPQAIACYYTYNACNLSQEPQIILQRRMQSQGKRYGALDYAKRLSKVSFSSCSNCEEQSQGFCEERRSYSSISNLPTTTAGRRTRICSANSQDLCSDRFSISKSKASGRDRRLQSSQQATKKCGRTEGLGIKPVRVERVEILRQQPQRVNTVYCLTVANDHNFFVNNILVHNCDFEKECDEWFGPEFRTSLSSFSVLSWANLRGSARVPNWFNKHANEIDEWAIAFDEVHNAKAGISSNQGTQFLKITNITDCWTGYTATPAKDWLGYYPYFTACHHIKNKSEFNRRFCVIETYRGFPDYVAFKNEEQLEKWWAEDSFAPDTSELDKSLPPETHIQKHFKKPIGYDKVDRTGYDLDGNFIETNSGLRHYLRKMCATKEKMQWITDFIDGLQESCVIFYTYVDEGDKIESIIKKNKTVGKVWRISGKVHDIPTKETLGKKDVVLAQWASGSNSINLQFINYWVSVTPHDSFIVSKQAQGRIQRIGADKPKFYYYLRCDNTEEDNIYSNLKNQKEFTDRAWVIKRKMEGRYLPEC